ncbi:MAG: hypothetical protein WD077_10685 [Bacteroidia bacterium]
MDNLADIGLYVGYFLIIVAVLLTLGAGIVHMFRHFRKDQDILYGLAGLIIIMGLAFLISDNEVLKSYEAFDITPFKSKMIGSGLIATYFLGGLAIIGIVAAEIISMFR